MSNLFATPALAIACMALMITSGFMQQRAVEKWTQETGRAPMIHRGKGSWGRFMRGAKNEMPASLLRQISVWKWVGFSALILLLAVTFSAGSQQH